MPVLGIEWEQHEDDTWIIISWGQPINASGTPTWEVQPGAATAFDSEIDHSGGIMTLKFAGTFVPNSITIPDNDHTVESDPALLPSCGGDYDIPFPV